MDALLKVNKELKTDSLNIKSLLNLKHYLILREKDRTELQEKLFLLGLSSLGRSYAHILASVSNIYDQLCYFNDREELNDKDVADLNYISIQDATAIASQNAKELFGKNSGSIFNKQHTSIMITLPSHAAKNNGALIHQLANAGVNIFRINTAHDNETVWKEMADVIFSINEKRKPDDKIKIFVDLAGPKIRTGKIQKIDMPIVIGSNKIEKEVMICSCDLPTKGEEINPETLDKNPAQIAVKKAFFKHLAENKEIQVNGFNHKKAVIKLTEVTDTYAKGLINKKISVGKNSKLKSGKHEKDILNLQMQTDPIRLFTDDPLIITENDLLGRSAVLDEKNNIIHPAIISCGVKGVLASVKAGDKVFIDDGKIALSVVENRVDSILCSVLNAKEEGTLLKEEKGINFPDTQIKTKAITQADRSNALSVLPFADSLSISFCQTPDDVLDIQNLLYENNRSDIGIVVKIETKRAVTNMPKILKQLLRSQKSGVMIARGDLAIEVGFENMAYIQETLLDICEAAHIPVIWATQVLESKMKNNLPSRAEVTDAAMAGRAECVMLNKGSFALGTIDVLIHILDTMHSISKKNRQLLKKETLWH